MSVSTLVERKPPAVLPALSSLAALDAALQVMQLDDDNLLARIPGFDCLADDQFLGNNPHPHECVDCTPLGNIFYALTTPCQKL